MQEVRIKALFKALIANNIECLLLNYEKWELLPYHCTYCGQLKGKRGHEEHSDTEKLQIISDRNNWRRLMAERK